MLERKSNTLLIRILQGSQINKFRSFNEYLRGIQRGTPQEKVLILV